MSKLQHNTPQLNEIFNIENHFNFEKNKKYHKFVNDHVDFPEEYISDILPPYLPKQEKECSISFDIYEKAKPKLKTKKFNHRNWANYRSNEIDYYVNFSKKHEKKTEDYKKNIRVFNKTTRETFNLKHDPLKIQRDDYLWFFFNGKKLADNMKNAGNMTAIFTTMTLDSTYHMYSKKSKKYNPKYDKRNTIEKGAKVLQKSYIRVAKDFKVEREYVKIKSMRVIEPHANFTPHLHAIFFVETIYLDNFLNHLSNVSKDDGLGEQFDFEVLDDVAKSIGYLQKYIQKTAKPENEEEFHKFNGWKKKNKIRMFAMSRGGLERYLFKKINTTCNFSKDLEGENPIDRVLRECYIKVETTIENTGEVLEKEHNPFSNQRYIVKVKRTRSEKIIEHEPLLPIDESFKIENGWGDKPIIYHKIYHHKPSKEPLVLIFERDLEKVLIYKIEEFTIFDNVENKFLYKKSDFCLSKEIEAQEIIFNMETKKYNFSMVGDKTLPPIRWNIFNNFY